MGEGKILYSGIMGQYQLGNPYRESMGRGRNLESKLHSGRSTEGRPQCKKVRLCASQSHFEKADEKFLEEQLPPKAQKWC